MVREETRCHLLFLISSMGSFICIYHWLRYTNNEIRHLCLVNINTMRDLSNLLFISDNMGKM